MHIPVKRQHYVRPDWRLHVSSSNASIIMFFFVNAWRKSASEVVAPVHVVWHIAPCSSACYLLHTGFLLAVFFDPEDGAEMFFRNIGLHGVISHKKMCPNIIYIYGWLIHIFLGHTYLLTYLRGWAHLEEPPIVQPLKNFPAFYGTRRFNTAFTRALHWSLSWAISIQSTPSHPISLRSILILSTHLHLGYFLGIEMQEYTAKD
jgi:hypothetical protein